MKPDIDLAMGPKGVAMESPMEVGPDLGVDPAELEMWRTEIETLKQNPELFETVKAMFDEVGLEGGGDPALATSGMEPDDEIL